MRTIRRLYFYAVAFISIEVILWGLIGLMRTMLSSALTPGPDTLAQALALILVGLPIFLLHWVWAQRAASHDEEERASTLRAIFLYGILLATFVPGTQNVLALFNRTFIQTAGISSARAILGGQQTLLDNIIAIIMNGIAAAYFFTVLRNNWKNIASSDDFAAIRRIYRYIWVFYGLILSIFGVQQTLRFLFYIPTGVLGEAGLELFVNGTAMVLIGAPIWAYMWQVCQAAYQAEARERGAMLRMGVLYILSLAGVVVVLTSAGIVLDVLLRRLLGEAMGWEEMLRQASLSIAIGVPLAAVWAYYGHWLAIDIRAETDLPRRAGMQRLYFYILSFIGLIATFVGLSLILSFLVNIIAGSFNILWGDTLRPRLAGAIAALFAGLPLWLLTWRPMQAESLNPGDSGDHARRSLVRKFYLYLVIFACVIGGMISAVVLAYQLFNALLGGYRANDFLTTTLNALQVLVLFAIFLAYHLASLRRDGLQAASALSGLQAGYAVLVFERENSGFSALFIEAMKKAAPDVPVAAQPVEQGLPEAPASAQAVVLPSSLAFDPPEALRLWLKEFQGKKVVVPQPVEGWLWPGGISRADFARAAQMIRTLAEGREVQSSSSAPGWMIVVYVMAALFGLQTAFVVLMIVISALVGGL